MAQKTLENSINSSLIFKLCNEHCLCKDLGYSCIHPFHF